MILNKAAKDSQHQAIDRDCFDDCENHNFAGDVSRYHVGGAFFDAAFEFFLGAKELGRARGAQDRLGR